MISVEVANMQCETEEAGRCKLTVRSWSEGLGYSWLMAVLECICS